MRAIAGADQELTIGLYLLRQLFIFQQKSHKTSLNLHPLKILSRKNLCEACFLKVIENISDARAKINHRYDD